jgi:aarF domain-containing kinase
MKAVILDVLDYKKVFAEEAAGRGDKQARRDCHTRSAQRMLEALKKNSGIYVKLGQHVAAVQVLPKEWTSTMTPLQDQCFPTPREDIDTMLREDLGKGIDELFDDFDDRPIGVASLAQVHRAVDKRTGRSVAIKLQHADLQEFVAVDMMTVNFAIKMVKWVFPEFEFDWLAQEMNEMLPLELDFRHEAENSATARRNFAYLKGKTSLHIPEVLWAERRCMAMEYIAGARVDNLAYLKENGIDRNQVSLELSRIFSEMVYIHSFFHADPHLGNLLIRTKAPGSASPFNFDICLLDHGQYFDIPDDLRVSYAHFWLSLMRGSDAERRKWAKAVGNVDDEMYPILESAITGQTSLGKSALLDSGGTDVNKLRSAMMEREGLILDIFELLRVVPRWVVRWFGTDVRRLLMILKLSDLQRSLDQSLNTTHSPVGTAS